jgi:hypothetical protein
MQVPLSVTEAAKKLIAGRMIGNEFRNVFGAMIIQGCMKNDKF